jgi:hypothetical protein
LVRLAFAFNSELLHILIKFPLLLALLYCVFPETKLREKLYFGICFRQARYSLFAQLNLSKFKAKLCKSRVRHSYPLLQNERLDQVPPALFATCVGLHHGEHLVRGAELALHPVQSGRLCESVVLNESARWGVQVPLTLK